MAEKKAEEKVEQKGIDFNEVLQNIYGKPLTQAKPTQEQVQEMRDAQAIANNRAADPSEVREALETLRRIEKDVPEPELRLGEVCIRALQGEAKVKEHDAQQLQNRTRYALGIRGTYDNEDYTGEFATAVYSDKKVTLICALIKETYDKSAVIFSRANALLHGREQDDMGPDDE